MSGRPAVIFTSCCGVWLLPLSRLLLSLSFRQQGLCLCSFCCCGGLFPVSSPCLSQPGSLTHSQRGPVRQGCSYDEGSLCSWLCPSISFFLGLIAPYLNPWVSPVPGQNLCSPSFLVIWLTLFPARDGIADLACYPSTPTNLLLYPGSAHMSLYVLRLFISNSWWIIIPFGKLK